jgi:AraC-like DNA-binding protein/DNA-binding CsgD family transcriptional regulator
MRVTELALSQAASPSLARAGIHEVDQLAEYTTGELIRRPEFSSGVELYELICELHRHGLTPFSRHGGHVHGEREREMFRLRAVEGLTLDQIGERFGMKRERVRQLLRLHFGLEGVPPSAKRRPPIKPRSSTLGERRRLYLLARVVVKRHYSKSLTLERVAKALASSPRQLQRAYAQFGDVTFHDDLVGRRMDAAAELLSLPSIPVRDVARRAGYRQASDFARVFRRRYGVSPSAYRAALRERQRREAPGVVAA